MKEHEDYAVGEVGQSRKERLKRADLLNYFRKLERAAQREIYADQEERSTSKEVDADRIVDADGQTGRQGSGNNVVVSAPSMALPSQDSVPANRTAGNNVDERGGDTTQEEVHACHFFPIKDDLNSLDVLRCEELLRNETARVRSRKLSNNGPLARDEPRRVARLFTCNAASSLSIDFRQTCQPSRHENKLNRRGANKCFLIYRKTESPAFEKHSSKLADRKSFARSNERTNTLSSEHAVTCKNNATTWYAWSEEADEVEQLEEEEAEEQDCEPGGEASGEDEEEEGKEKGPCKQINTRRGGKCFGRFCESEAEKGGAMPVVYRSEYCFCSENVDTFGRSDHRSRYVECLCKATKDDLDSEKNSRGAGETLPTLQQSWRQEEQRRGVGARFNQRFNCDSDSKLSARQTWSKLGVDRISSFYGTRAGEGSPTAKNVPFDETQRRKELKNHVSRICRRVAVDKQLSRDRGTRVVSKVFDRRTDSRRGCIESFRQDAMKTDSSVTCRCTRSNLPRFGRCGARESCWGTNQGSPPVGREPAARVVRPSYDNRKTNLKKVLVYPPPETAGAPLTLYKNVSNVKCTVRGNDQLGFRYDVTYVQKFASPLWQPEENVGNFCNCN